MNEWFTDIMAEPFIFQKDLFGFILILCLYLLQTHFGISSFSHPDNALEVCGLLTPLHILPEWYLLCHYLTLKAVQYIKAVLIILFFTSILTFSSSSSREKKILYLKNRRLFKKIGLVGCLHMLDFSIATKGILPQSVFSSCLLVYITGHPEREVLAICLQYRLYSAQGRLKEIGFFKRVSYSLFLFSILGYLN